MDDKVCILEDEKSFHTYRRQRSAPSLNWIQNIKISYEQNLKKNDWGQIMEGFEYMATEFKQAFISISLGRRMIRAVFLEDNSGKK